LQFLDAGRVVVDAQGGRTQFFSREHYQVMIRSGCNNN